MKLEICDKRWLKNLQNKYPSFSYVPASRIYVSIKNHQCYDLDLIVHQFNQCKLSNPFMIFPNRE